MRKKVPKTCCIAVKWRERDIVNTNVTVKIVTTYQFYHVCCCCYHYYYYYYSGIIIIIIITAATYSTHNIAIQLHTEHLMERCYIYRQHGYHYYTVSDILVFDFKFEVHRPICNLLLHADVFCTLLLFAVFRICTDDAICSVYDALFNFIDLLIAVSLSLRFIAVTCIVIGSSLTELSRQLCLSCISYY